MEGIAEPFEIHPHGTADQQQCFGIFSHIPDWTSGRARAATLAYAMRTDSTLGIGCNHHRRAFSRHAHDHRLVWMGITIGRAPFGSRAYGDAHEKRGMDDGCRLDCRPGRAVFFPSECGTHRPLRTHRAARLIVKKFLARLVVPRSRTQLRTGDRTFRSGLDHHRPAVLVHAARNEFSFLGFSRNFGHGRRSDRIDEIPYMAVKKDGRRERFDRQKVLAGLLKACEKRPVSMIQLETIADKAEAMVQESSEREVNTRSLGEMIMNELKNLDKVAYVRFASI